jgi:propionyl-CoA carboxylase alpha chain
MFKKILIANRGEIACRIIRTAKRLGILTVAVFSDADRDARHVELADEAFALGPAPAADSYLRIDRIIEACRATGAEAVHPGYGFLAERADFAEALEAEGIAFIGPNPRAIAAMGDKIESKKIAKAARVATVPGFAGEIEDAAHARLIAFEIGYPVMIKASAGGGGKGMRIIRSKDEIAEGFLRATSEAKAAFGDGRILIEKFIERPRHIEIQVLGDKFGNLIHLGERECSIQRRHQKLIEEAPSPLVDEELRAKMGVQAIALAKTVSYDSAGTVEFVVGPDKSFYFLEMNTRLQVEHPVTELVTGIDLVEQMIRIASGEPLALTQADIHLRGSAIECRICAEDPSRDFLPSSGRLKTYAPPPEGHHAGVTLRHDSGVGEGDEVSIFYDSLIAKLVVHAGDRAAAIDAQRKALDRFVIDGIRHNIPFLAAVMRHSAWQAGELSTSFIEEAFPGGFIEREPEGEDIHRFAAISAFADHVMNERKRLISGQMPTARKVRFERDRSVMLGRTRLDVRLEDGDDGLLVRFEADGHAHLCVSDWTPAEKVWIGTIDGEEIAVAVRPALNGFWLAHGGMAAAAKVYTRREADLAALMPEKALAGTSKALLCPMPGLVKAINVLPGQAVKTGMVLCVIEAMKMENVLRAERDVVIKTIVAVEGQSLAVDAVILEFA